MTPEEFGGLRREITRRLVQTLVQMFTGLGSWRDPDVVRFVALAQPQVLGAQQALSALTSAYIADRATEAAGRPVAPPVLGSEFSDYQRHDVAFGEVYTRPFVTVRTALSRAPDADPVPDVDPTDPADDDTIDIDPQPTPRVPDDDSDVLAAVEQARRANRAQRDDTSDSDVLAAVERARREARASRQERLSALERAVEQGANRLAQVAEMDLQQTFAESARGAMEALPEDVRPTGWRRVLVGDVNCALCIVASTQLYRISELNPMHPACDCTVDPWFGEDTHVIEPELLEQVHAAVFELTGQVDRGARAIDYRELLGRMTPEHGEVGPMLVHPRHRFRKKYALPA